MSSKTDEAAAAVADLVAFFQDLERSAPGFAHPEGGPQRRLVISTEEGSREVELDPGVIPLVRRRSAGA